jgi:hypothetical protein
MMVQGLDVRCHSGPEFLIWTLLRISVAALPTNESQNLLELRALLDWADKASHMVHIWLTIIKNLNQQRLDGGLALLLREWGSKKVKEDSIHRL